MTCVKIKDNIYEAESVVKKKKNRESKMAEEYVDMENISLHRYIRNPPSDTDVHPKHPAEGGQEELTSGKEYIEPRKTRQDKGSGGKQEYW